MGGMWTTYMAKNHAFISPLFHYTDMVSTLTFIYLFLNKGRLALLHHHNE